MLSVQDKKNINEIRDFLISNDISFVNKDNNTFSLYEGNPAGKRNYEICYVASRLYPIKYEKYNINGVEKDYFYKLSLKAEENNSFKCWIKDFEWQDNRKREVLKSYIMYAGGKITKRYYARDCEVREVNSKEARSFEEQHCFYGTRGASLNLGLFSKKEKYGNPKGTLLMIYTFGKNFFGKNNDIEVLRVGTLKFHNVVGGASKLLKYFIINYPVLEIGKNKVSVEKLKFYSDYDHNIGLSLDTLGFEFVNYSEGGFMNYWLETGEVKGRQPNKHGWVMDQMKEGKVLAIPNAGVKTFILDIPKYIKKNNIDQKKEMKEISNLEKWF